MSRNFPHAGQLQDATSREGKKLRSAVGRNKRFWRKFGGHSDLLRRLLPRTLGSSPTAVAAVNACSTGFDDQLALTPETMVTPSKEILVPAVPLPQGGAAGQQGTPKGDPASLKAPNGLETSYQSLLAPIIVAPPIKPWNATNIWTHQFGNFDPLESAMVDRVRYVFTSYNRVVKAVPALRV